MAQYHLKRVGRYSRRTEIAKGGITFRVVALLIAFLLAFTVWLYMKGQALSQETNEDHTAPVTDTVGDGAVSSCVTFEGEQL